MFAKATVTFAATLVCSSIVMVQGACPCFHRMYGKKNFTVCADRSLTEIPECVPSDIVYLTISTPTIPLVPEILQRFTKLIQLGISDFTDVVDISPNFLLYQHSLHNFDVSNTSLDYVDNRWLILAPNLDGVGMNNNNITSVPENTFRSLSKLEWVRLEGNQLTTLPATIFEGTSLKGLTLANNPWHCECELMKFLRWFWDHGANLEDEPLCWQPKDLRGLKLRDLTEDIACEH